jgi:FkbM family methyltransferase
MGAQRLILSDGARAQHAIWEKNMKVPFFKRLSRQVRGRRRAKILASYGIAVVANAKNGLLAVQPGDFNVSRALLQAGEYDWPQIGLLSGLVGANSRLIFAGAHIGALLIPIVRAAGTRAVYAYEPSPNNHQLLAMNLALNGIDGVVVRNSALGDSPGTVRFTENRINTGNCRVDMSGGELAVSVDTLDRSVPPEWDSIDLIVMDVEGSEVAAMRGAPTVLAKTKRLYAEFAPEQLREQGATCEEFIALAARFFKSAYVVDGSMKFLRAAEFSAHLLPLSKRRGLLLNLLFTQDAESSKLMMPESIEPASSH